MRRTILLCLVALIGFALAGCGPQLTDEEKNAPPPRGPNAGYQPPPAGANPGARGAAGAPQGGGMPAGANPSMTH